MHTIKYTTAVHVASCTHLYMQERTFALIIHIRMFLAPCSIYARKIFPLYLYIYNQVHYCSACCFKYTFGNNICSDYTYWLPAPFMQGNYFSLIICIFLPPHTAAQGWLWHSCLRWGSACDWVCAGCGDTGLWGAVSPRRQHHSYICQEVRYAML